MYTQLKRLIISHQQQLIAQLGFKPVLHFELEGCVQFNANVKDPKINFTRINQQLAQYAIDAQLVPEYWSNQWEYVSLFNGQLPLKEADNLAKSLTLLPKLFQQQGVEHTLIKPVVWHGDHGKMAGNSTTVMSHQARAVHIPNAVQINLSAQDLQGNNIIPEQHFGEYLQACMLKTSYACSLLFLPEQEAFERLLLKTRYGLQAELCSPNDLSGGHQGSIALYKEFGKHNQKLGQEPLLLDQQAQPLSMMENWRKTARVEHRLGAASRQYDSYWNVIFALANLIDALFAYVEHKCAKYTEIKPIAHQLPATLADTENALGAISLFEQETWLAQHLTDIGNNEAFKQALWCLNGITKTTIREIEQQGLANYLKQGLLNQYKPKPIAI